MKRLISLSDGTSMGDLVIIFETDAPVEELKTLEKISCDVYINGGYSEDIPIWADILRAKGYVFDYVDEHQHVSVYRTSSEWIENKYPQIEEHYYIEEN